MTRTHPDTPRELALPDIVQHTDGEDGATLGWHVEWGKRDHVYCGEVSDRELDRHEEDQVEMDDNQFWLFIKGPDDPPDGMGRLIGRAVDAEAAYEIVMAFRAARATEGAP